jgi:PAS domain-containing protein
MVELRGMCSRLSGGRVASLNWAVVFWVCGVAFAASVFGILALVLAQSRMRPRSASVFDERTGATIFLFDGETLVDATPEARALLATLPVRGGAWHRLLSYLAPRFPGVEHQLATLHTDGSILLVGSGPSPGSDIHLQAEWRGGLMRLTLWGSEDQHQVRVPDPLAQRAMADELAMLRHVVSQAPMLIWRENDAAEVTWANAAYLGLAARRLEPEKDLSWPLPRLLPPPVGPEQRLRLDGTADTETDGWYQATAIAVDGGRTVFAQPSDALVRAEAALRNFRQTLTKTFAHLPIGLAIFDRDRQLALFNPALLDLTGLPADFLSSRPTLFAFLDAMRDRNMIPEPKDYRSWRRQMTDLEKAAASGRYEETWILPSGQTYRVIGRPHPDGAMALLFEDISTEMSRTRRYRADLELGQSVIDAMDEAVAVFSSSGILVMANAAYAQLWNHEPDTTLDEIGIDAMVAHWRTGSAPSEIWASASEFVAALGEREAWTGSARLNDGRLIRCRFTPLSGGTTMISFRLAGTSSEDGAVPTLLRA